MGRDTGPAHTPDPINAREQWRGLESAMPIELINKPAALTNHVMDSYLFSPAEVQSRRREREYGLDQPEIDPLRAERESRAHSLGDDNITAIPYPGKMGYSSVDNGSLCSPRGTGTVTPVAQDYGKGTRAHPYSIFLPSSPAARTPSFTNGHREVSSRISSRLSISNILAVMKHSELQKVEPFFTDPTGIYYRMYEDLLEDLDGKNSQGLLCVEEYLMASEKDWFGRFHNAKMGRAYPVGTPRGASSTPRSDSQTPIGRTPSPKSRRSPWGGNTPAESTTDRPLDEADLAEADIALAQFALPDDYERPTGMKRLMLMKIGDWPLYTFLLALGQIIAANSYQITLLTGEVGQKPSKLYIIASIYLATSCLWWLLFRKFAALYVLAGAWFFYGLAFFLLGMAPLSSPLGRTLIQNIATGFYAAASSSGSFFFGLNFGSEG
jgi:alpha-1,3-glucan synthase